jgi:hypothetical protein
LKYAADWLRDLQDIDPKRFAIAYREVRAQALDARKDRLLREWEASLPGATDPVYDANRLSRDYFAELFMHLVEPRTTPQLMELYDQFLTGFQPVYEAEVRCASAGSDGDAVRGEVSAADLAAARRGLMLAVEGLLSPRERESYRIDFVDRQDEIPTLPSRR